MHCVCTRFRYKVVRPVDGEWGRFLPNGSVTGMIGMNQRQVSPMCRCFCGGGSLKGSLDAYQPILPSDDQPLSSISPTLPILLTTNPLILLSTQISTTIIYPLFQTLLFFFARLSKVSEISWFLSIFSKLLHNFLTKQRRAFQKNAYKRKITEKAPCGICIND